MISGSDDRTLRLWNMSTYICDTFYRKCILLFKHSFCLVNIDECVIENRIKDGALGDVRCFLKLRDNKTIKVWKY